MSDRLSDLRARIGATRQLETVVVAMRGIAAARTREAQTRLEGARAYAKALEKAIGAALTLAPETPAAEADRRDGHIVLALAAEQGFVGSYIERILAAARAIATHGGGALFLVGARGQALAAEQGLEPALTAPMIAHVDETPHLADAIADALYERLGAGEAARVTLIHGAPAEDGSAGPRLVARPLVPLDYSRIPASRARIPPLTTLEPRRLLAQLAEEYVFAQLCEAVALSYAAENEARMQAMIAARQNVRKTLDELTARYRRQRQEEITEEIVELAVR